MTSLNQEVSHIVLAFWGEPEDFLVEEVSSSLAISRDYAIELVQGAIIQELQLTNELDYEEDYYDECD